MKKIETSYSHSVLTTAVLSCVFLILAVWLSLVIRPPSNNRQNSQFGPISTPSPIVANRKTIQKPITSITALTNDQRQQCYRSCRLELVESVPENLTFADTVFPPLGSTHESWTKLINMAEKKLILAAYKSSFRGKHVLDQEHAHSARLGDRIFDLLKNAGVQRGLKLEAVENYPPKDRGDNEDVNALSDLGILDKRRLQMSRLQMTGVMHTKFMLADDSHFYLGSANFDWRSLNQKMELGVHVENCPCLADDLKIFYDTYWAAAGDDNDDTPSALAFQDLPALTSKSNPLKIRVAGADTEIYLAASPRQLNGIKRDWDLDAIVNVIDESRNQLDINVMDYVPLFVYQKPRKFWPIIDHAIRRAVVERGVKVRFLTAALHFTSESLNALQSLRVVCGDNLDVKILNIPAVTEAQKAFARERRTHRKFMVNDDTLLIGTSNWSGDYFANTTGVAIVMKQSTEHRQGLNGTESIDREQPLIDQARQLFERDWNSIYSTDLDDYLEKCYDQKTKRDLCKAGRMAYQQVKANTAYRT